MRAARSRHFEHVQMRDQVGGRIKAGIFNRVANPRLCAEVHDRVQVETGKRTVEGFVVAEVEPLESEFSSAEPAQFGDTRLLQRRIVIGIQIVDANYALASIE